MLHRPRLRHSIEQILGKLREKSQAALNNPSLQTEYTDQQKELASCVVSYAICFSAISPIVGYSYTGRFKALGLFLIGGFISIVMLMQIGTKLNWDDRQVAAGLGVSIAAIAAADNSRAILAARRGLQ